MPRPACESYKIRERKQRKMLDSSSGSQVILIIAAGEFYGKVPEKYDYVIAVDGGLEHCEKLGIKPDLIIGDFDSLGYVPDGENVIKLIPEKDQTDTGYAIDYFMNNIFSDKLNAEYFVHIFGATGGRISHTLANIQSLSVFLGYTDNITAYLYDKSETMTCIGKRIFEFEKRDKGYVSVLARSDKANVSIEGLKYPLKRRKINNSFPLGTSNEFIGQAAKIAVHEGEVLIIWER